MFFSSHVCFHGTFLGYTPQDEEGGFAEGGLAGREKKRSGGLVRSKGDKDTGFFPFAGGESALRESK